MKETNKCLFQFQGGKSSFLLTFRDICVTQAMKTSSYAQFDLIDITFGIFMTIDNDVIAVRENCKVAFGMSDYLCLRGRIKQKYQPFDEKKSTKQTPTCEDRLKLFTWQKFGISRTINAKRINK